MSAEWVVPVQCDEETHTLVVGSRDRAVVVDDHPRGVPDTSSCSVASQALQAALAAAPGMEDAVAGAVFYLRQARRAHPRGDWDDGHRWYPDEAEWRDCCESIRPPSRAWPWSLMVHCRTAAHVAALYGIDPKVLRRSHRAISAVMGPPGSHRER